MKFSSTRECGDVGGRSYLLPPVRGLNCLTTGPKRLWRGVQAHVAQALQRWCKWGRGFSYGPRASASRCTWAMMTLYCACWRLPVQMEGSGLAFCLQATKWPSNGPTARLATNSPRWAPSASPTKRRTPPRVAPASRR